VRPDFVIQTPIVASERDVVLDRLLVMIAAQ
jgi:hypothetical protein